MHVPIALFGFKTHHFLYLATPCSVFPVSKVLC